MEPTTHPPERPRTAWKHLVAGGCLGTFFGAVALLTALLVAYNFYQQKAVQKMAETKELKPVQLRADYAWEVKGVDGAPLSLETLKGKPIFLHLWRPGCVSCVAEIPGINALHEAYAAWGMQFVAIALGDVDDLDGELQMHGVEFPVYTVEGDKLPPMFSTTSTPTTFIIDRDGFIVYSHSGGVDWNSDDGRAFVESLLRGQ
jgi:thiol-disulfide isomerase/thioredoxin